VKNLSAEALRYGTRCRGNSRFYLHTHTLNHERNEPAFTFLAEVGPHLTTPCGWKTEQAYSTTTGSKARQSPQLLAAETFTPHWTTGALQDSVKLTTSPAASRGANHRTTELPKVVWRRRRWMREMFVYLTTDKTFLLSPSSHRRGIGVPISYSKSHHPEHDLDHQAIFAQRSYTAERQTERLTPFYEITTKA